MQKTISLLVCFFVLSSAAAQKLYIDAVHADISFEFPAKKINGTLGGLQVWTADLDVNDLSNSYVSGSIAVETIKTQNFLRDKLWQGKKLFGKKHHPRIHFKGESIVKKGDSYIVSGTLKIKEVTKLASFEFMQNEGMLIGVCSVNLADFGLNIFKKRMENRVTVKLRLPIYNPTGPTSRGL